MQKFDFKEWLQGCAFSQEEAAQALEIPISLVEHYVVTRTSMPNFRIKKAEDILVNRKKQAEKEIKISISNKGAKESNYNETLNDLYICLNLEADKHGGGIFWKHGNDTEALTQFQLDLNADLLGFRMKSLKIQTNFEDNKFQPHEKVQTKNMPVFYMVDLFLADSYGKPYDRESFAHFVSMTPTFREKRRKLTDKNIYYVYDYDINNIVRKVFS